VYAVAHLAGRTTWQFERLARISTNNHHHESMNMFIATNHIKRAGLELSDGRPIMMPTNERMLRISRNAVQQW